MDEEIHEWMMMRTILYTLKEKEMNNKLSGEWKYWNKWEIPFKSMSLKNEWMNEEIID